MYASISCTLFYASLAFMHKFYKEKNPENRRTKNGEGLGTRLSDPAKTTNKQTNKQTPPPTTTITSLWESLGAKCAGVCILEASLFP